jgi:hypothetical protein
MRWRNRLWYCLATVEGFMAEMKWTVARFIAATHSVQAAVARNRVRRMRATTNNGIAAVTTSWNDWNPRGAGELDIPLSANAGFSGAE